MKALGRGNCGEKLYAPRPIRDDPTMRPLALLAVLTCAACAETFPDVVPLAPGADDVEVISDPPNEEVYEAVGGVSARVSGTETSTAVREAKNALRNQAARRGATFVSIDDISSRPSFDLRSKTVVSISGTAYRAK